MGKSPMVGGKNFRPIKNGIICCGSGKYVYLMNDGKPNSPPLTLPNTTMSHKIGEIDLALGTVERDASEPKSWHALETEKEGMNTENCNLRKMEIERGQVKITVKGAEYDAPLFVPCIPHPLEAGKLHFLGKPYDPSSYELFDSASFLDFAGECFKAAGMDNSLSFVTTLYDGSRMTLARRLPEADFQDAHGHQINSYINLLNSVDGSWPVFANISEIRTVCYNTATANLMEGGAGCKHTPKALSEFVARFPDTLAEALTAHKGSANEYLQMAEIPLSFTQAQGFFIALLSKGKLSARSHNLVNDNLMPLFVRGKGCYGQTAADCYNAVTEYFTHNSSNEANSPDGSADMKKREARSMLLSDKLMESIEAGKKMLGDYHTR